MTLTFAKTDPTGHGEPIEVAPGAVRLVAPNPGPFTFTGSSSFIIGRDRLVIIDPGPDKNTHTDAVAALIGDRAVDAVLLTHRHIDHAGAARAVADRVGAPLLAGPLPETLDLAPPPWASAAEEAFLSNLETDQDLRDGDEIFLGDDVCLRCHATPGHTPDHFCFELSHTGHLFTGDHVMGWATTAITPPYGDMAAYLASLHICINLDVQTLHPTHGACVMDGKAHMQALMDHRLDRHRQVADHALAHGSFTLLDLLNDIYPDLSPALQPAAMMVILSHLDLLSRQTELTLESGNALDGSYTFGQPPDALVFTRSHYLPNGVNGAI